MKTILFAALLSFLPFHTAFAQIQDLLSNPDITWVAETELEYDFEPEYLEGSGIPETDRRYEYRVRKNDFSYCDNAYSMIYRIGDAVERGELMAYDKAGGKQLTKEEIDQRFLLGFDSLTTIDPETFEERIKVVSVCEPAFSRVQSILVKQIWYYNSKSKQLANRVVGVSLMLPVENKKGEDVLNRKKVLLYVIFSVVAKKALHINLPNVPFCMETSEYLEIDSFKTLKGDVNKTFEHFFFQLPKSKAIEISSIEIGRCCNELIAEEEYEKIFNASDDSTFTFDLATYEERIKVVTRPALQFEDYSKQYKVVQTWYFDINTNQIVSTIDAVAPAKDMVDDNGNFLYNYPLFYVCFSKENRKARRK